MDFPLLDIRSAEAFALRGREYRSASTVQAVRLTQACTWTTTRGSVLSADSGDWMLTSGDDKWSVGDDIFRSSYCAQRDGTWRKTSTVRAVRIDQTVEVETLEGIATAQAGDWIVTSPGAGAWPVESKVFASRYRLVVP